MLVWKEGTHDIAPDTSMLAERMLAAVLYPPAPASPEAVSFLLDSFAKTRKSEMACSDMPMHVVLWAISGAEIRAVSDHGSAKQKGGSSDCSGLGHFLQYAIWSRTSTTNVFQWRA